MGGITDRDETPIDARTCAIESSVPKSHVRHLFGRVRPRRWRFEEGLDQTKARSVADVRADMVRNSEH